MIYTETGYRQLVFEISGAVFEIIASSLFTLLLLMLAQGWTISHFEIKYPKILFTGIILLSLFQLGLFIWRLLLLDPETTQYFYNFTPMWCYGGLFSGVGLIYLIQCIYSYRHEPLQSKKSLYRMLMIFFTTWFLVPLLRIVVADSFEPWSRDMFILTIEMTWDTVTFILMIGLMWPSRAHKFFNLSIKDTQNRMLDSHTNSKNPFETLEDQMRMAQDTDKDMEMDDVDQDQHFPIIQDPTANRTNKRFNQLADDRL